MMHKAFQRCYLILTSKVEQSDVPWLKRHCKFVAAPTCPARCIGFGFAVFSQEAILAVEKNIRKTFEENGAQPLINILACRQLAIDLKKKDSLANKYIVDVLIKEALVVLMEQV
ncbi:hypothetical protein DPMN_082867 [Dreissena polymorpha]|uniref:Uncharacterized protein n=1 Tax=Dreissena polymorpha TaxID=45954 RepID=A0A9D4BJ90_DREPO|nr:hypothetical protein DPMN_082867 [Dreissena polymorpha]